MFLQTWRSTKSFVSKYWQLLIGLVAVVALLLRQFFNDRAQKAVLKNELEAAQKINRAKEEYDENIEKAEIKASTDHEARVEKIKEKTEAALRNVERATKTRIKNNNETPDDDMVNRFANTFGAEVVKVDDDE